MTIQISLFVIYAVFLHTDGHNMAAASSKIPLAMRGRLARN